MAQFGRPASDITTGWATTPLWQKIDEAVADDNDFITGTGDAKTFECKFSAVTDPNSSTGHVVRIRARATGSGAAERLNTWGLYQGTTAIVTQNASITRGSFNGYSITLSAAQADSISDYTDLRIRGLTAQGSTETIDVSWAEFECPDASTAHTKSLADTVTLSDAIVNKPVAIKSDTVTLSDAAVKAPGISAADTVTLSDSFTDSFIKSLNDSLALSESSTSLVSKNLSDQVTLEDSIDRQVNLFLELSDSVILQDSTDRQGGFFLDLSDSVTLQDSVSPGLVIPDKETEQRPRHPYRSPSIYESRSSRPVSYR